MFKKKPFHHEIRIIRRLIKRETKTKYDIVISQIKNTKILHLTVHNKKDVALYRIGDGKVAIFGYTFKKDLAVQIGFIIYNYFIKKKKESD